MGLKSTGFKWKIIAFVYFYTLEGIRSWAFQMGTKNPLKVKVDGLNLTFMLSAGKLYNYYENFLKVRCESMQIVS